ncbi:MAG: type II secretion system protein [Planctomycetota bacterium]|jgi:prepilin-type N-terminal cleavage/methylation domain-containing protein/prepilin-type processing-associated H-X9-DG protein
MFLKRRQAFTLLELLVVIAVIALLMSILMPALAAANSQARSAVCRSNVRHLVLANMGYATENDGYYVPAASDMWNNGGYQRWHGVRGSLNEPFDPLKGPLAKYLSDGKVKNCPEPVEFVKGHPWSANFEQGCGGYGYNMAYLGSRLWQKGNSHGQPSSYSRTTSVSEAAKPGETVMFADCAMSTDGRTLIEYSFAEPPYAVYNGMTMTGFYMSPSIHFRHRNAASVGWADGHVDPPKMAAFEGDNAYGVDSAAMKLGWFEPVDNSLFDLK